MKTCFSLLSLLIVLATFAPSTEGRVSGSGRRLFGSDTDYQDIYDRCCVENDQERSCKKNSADGKGLKYQGCCCPIREEGSKYGQSFFFKYAESKWTKKCNKLEETYGQSR
jgi:hypothetical protein